MGFVQLINNSQFDTYAFIKKSDELIMECNWNSKLAFLIINTFFVTTGCFLNTRIYSLDSFNNSPSLKIEGLTINEHIHIFSGNVSNYLLSVTLAPSLEHLKPHG